MTMCDITKDVRISWQLVSQFVSWDFCRYMCEQQNDLSSSEPDVLTFLRNMIVKRTEKAVSSITKQEIVAKFVMEAKLVRTPTQLPALVELSRAMTELCPELETLSKKLICHLQSLLDALDWNTQNQNNDLTGLVSCRINHAIIDFTTEASKTLPIPDLIQIIQSWIHTEMTVQAGKEVQNIDLYNKVIACLRKELITTTEAKIIAVALYEDKSLEKFFFANSQAEVELESQPLTQSSQAPSEPLNSDQLSQLTAHFGLVQRMQRVMQTCLKPSQPNNASFSLESPSQHNLSKCATDIPHQSQKPPGTNQTQELDSEASEMIVEQIQDMEPLDKVETYLFAPVNPEPLTPGRIRKSLPSISSLSSEESPHNLLHRKLSGFSKSPEMSPENRMRRAVSSCSSKSPGTSPVVVAKTKGQKKLRVFVASEEEDSNDADWNTSPVENAQQEETLLDWMIVHNEQNADCYQSGDSDCDKHAVIRILTPTIYKKGHHPPVDHALPKRHTDPVISIADFSSIQSPSVSLNIDSQKNDPNWTTTSPSKRKKPAASSDPPRHRDKSKKSSKRKRSSETHKKTKKKQTTLRDFLPSHLFRAGGDTKNSSKKKKTFKLFDNDIVPSLNETAQFQVQKSVNKPKLSLKEKIDSVGNRRNCRECDKKFRGPNELKRHIFLCHTPADINTQTDDQSQTQSTDL